MSGGPGGCSLCACDRFKANFWQKQKCICSHVLSRHNWVPEGSTSGSLTVGEEKKAREEKRKKREEEEKKKKEEEKKKKEEKKKNRTSTKVSASVITGPTMVRHEGHLGYGGGGFEARNLPPHIQEVFNALDVHLRQLGEKALTQKEAKFLMKFVLQALPPIPPAGAATPTTSAATSSTTTSSATITPPSPAPTPAAEPTPAPAPTPKFTVTSFKRNAVPKDIKNALSGEPIEELLVKPVGDQPPKDQQATEQPKAKAQPSVRAVAGVKYENEIRRLEAEIQQFQESKKLEAQKLQERDQEIETLLQRLSDEQALVQQLRVEATENKRLVKDEGKKRKALQELVEQLKLEIEELRTHDPKALADLQVKMEASAREQLATEVSEKAQLEDEITKLREETSDLMEKLRIVQGHTDKATSDAKRYREESDENAAKVKLLEEQANLFKQDLQELRNRVSELEDERELLEQQLEEQEQEREQEQEEREREREERGQQEEENGEEEEEENGSTLPPPPPPAPAPPPPPSIPAPPTAPAVPPPAPTGSGSLISALAGAPKLKATPTQETKKDERSTLLSDIKGGVQLKKVDDTQKAAPQVDDSLLGMLAKRIMDRRAAIKDEDREDDDDPFWGD